MTRYVELLIAIDDEPDRPAAMRFYVTRNLTIPALCALARDLETAENDGEDIEGVLDLWAQLREMRTDYDSTAKHEAPATATAPGTFAATAAADHLTTWLWDWPSEASRRHRADGGRRARLMLALRRQRRTRRPGTDPAR